MNKRTFRESGYGGGSNDCVEVADTPNPRTDRDPKSPGQTPLAFDRPEWRAFLNTTRGGRL